MEIKTKEKITWCPGCVNFLIKKAFEDAIEELISEGYKQEDFVMVTDIGCSGKIYDYVNISGINSLHGRTIPTMLGVKIGNPNLSVIGFAGDGGTYDEGIAHFIHACRYNEDTNLFVNNNQVFALTVGQATPTTEEGFKEKTRPEGVKMIPLNPLVLAIESEASFVARANALDIQGTKEIFKQAIKHKGFSFVDILQPCIKFHDTREYFKNNIYKINPLPKEQALKEAKKWNYELKGKIPVGIFFKEERDSFEDEYEVLMKLKNEGKGFWNLNK